MMVASAIHFARSRASQFHIKVHITRCLPVEGEEELPATCMPCGTHWLTFRLPRSSLRRNVHPTVISKWRLSHLHRRDRLTTTPCLQWAACIDGESESSAWRKWSNALPTQRTALWRYDQSDQPVPAHALAASALVGLRAASKSTSADHLLSNEGTTLEGTTAPTSPTQFMATATLLGLNSIATLRQAAPSKADMAEYDSAPIHLADHASPDLMVPQ